MTIREAIKILDAECIAREDLLDKDITTACGSDMMSDVLAYNKVNAVLITGLCNPQVIRTCEMMDIECVVFCRGKIPTEEMIEMAKENELVVLTTRHRMFNTCGLLYKGGLKGGET